MFAQYEKASGAALNLEKCVGMWVSGPVPRKETYFGIPFVASAIKCLGVYFSTDYGFMLRKNWGIAGHNLPDKSCVADTAMQIELAQQLSKIVLQLKSQYNLQN